MASAGGARKINKDWLVLDSTATCSMTNNHTPLSNIHTSTAIMDIYTNSGKTRTDQVGSLEFLDLDKMWLKPDAMATILALHETKQKF